MVPLTLAFEFDLQRTKRNWNLFKRKTALQKLPVPRNHLLQSFALFGYRQEEDSRSKRFLLKGKCHGGNVKLTSQRFLRMPGIDGDIHFRASKRGSVLLSRRLES